MVLDIRCAKFQDVTTWISFSINAVLTRARLSNITMHALMPYNTALMPECLITNRTAVRVLTTMYTSMCIQIALMTEFLVTHITAIWVITTMYASMYYQSALCTECLITYRTYISVIKTMYITGRSAFSTVHMKFFIQSTLLKIQRLNIRIYCDRKTNIFIPIYTLNKCFKICCMIST